MSKTILIAGGTGLIGTRLQQMLRDQGFAVRLLTRRPKAVGEYGWDPASGAIDDKALQGAYAVINLAGAGIAEARWTPERKKILVDSRIQSARTLLEAFQRMDALPEVYLSASAVGWYGDSGETLVDEDSRPGRDGFMPECCIAWEEAAETISALGIRTAVLRIGIVLAKEGGALPEIARTLPFGVAAYFADGSAWWSWIHRDDVCAMFLWALANEQVDGLFNAVAPHPVRNIELVKAVARATGKHPFLVPAPAFALRMALGEMSAVVLNSNKVSCDKALEAGFHFHYPELEGALHAIY